MPPARNSALCPRQPPTTSPLSQEAGVPVTNYGLLLSYAHSPAALERAMKPWGLSMQS